MADAAFREQARRARHMRTPAHTSPTQAARRRAGRRRLVVVSLLFVAVASVIAGAAVARHSHKPAAPKPPFVRTDRGIKAQMLKKLKEPPQLLIFGGSRATRFEPSYLQKLTGLRGFNLAFQNGRPEDAWAFVHYVRALHPDAKPRIVWFTHVEAFREQGLSPGLVQDPALARWFPRALVAEERAKLPETKAEAPKGRDLALTRFGPDGAVLRNRYDLAVEHGRTLKRAVDWTIGQALERYRTTTPALFPRSQLYFEKTVRLLNDLSVKPVIVFMPLHPRLLAAVRPAGWTERRTEVMAYLHGLQRTLDFTVLDFTELSSFGGDPKGFYDGFHIRQANARRLLDAVVAQAPDSFK